MASGGSHEPNLTPFIDLFSVLVCFLLMTAAWIQLESIEVTIGPITSKDPATTPPGTPPPPDKPDMKVHIELTKESLKITQNKVDKVFQRGQWAADLGTLKTHLEALKANTPTTEDVILKSMGEVNYGELIETYDSVIAAGWPSVAISPY